MAEPYFSELRAIFGRMRTGHDEMKAVSCRHFFSGAAAYADGRIFMSCSPVGLALKLPNEDCAALFAQGATHLRYFPKAPVKKGYVVLPSQLVADGDALTGWIIRGIRFARK